MSLFSRKHGPTTKRCSLCKAGGAQSVSAPLAIEGVSISITIIIEWLCEDCFVLVVTELSRRGLLPPGSVLQLTTSKENRGT